MFIRDNTTLLMKRSPMSSPFFMPELRFVIEKEQKHEAGPSINVNLFTPEATLAYVRQKLLSKEGFALATLNLDHIVKLVSSQTFFEAYRKHEAITADGFPIVWLGRLAGARITRTTGSDLFLPMIALAHELKAKIALVGTTNQALTLAAEKLQGLFPGLEIGFMESPAFGFDPTSEVAIDLLHRVEKSGAALCFLAFGAPKQELLAALGRKEAPSVGFASIGASIDFIAGSQKRAPRWAQASNLEWLWRLMTNPRRLSKRYAQCALIFPVYLVRSLLRGRGAA